MTKSRLLQCAVVATLLVVAAAIVPTAKPAIAANQGRPETADLVLINGKILTVDAKDSIAQAVAIKGGKIVAVGSSEAILQWAGSATRVIDLHGRTATPGLIDTHGHFADGGVNELYHVNLSDSSRVEDVVGTTGRGGEGAAI